MDFLNRHSVLVLNSLYQCIGTLTPKKALIALNSSSDQNNIVAKAIDVVYKTKEDGSLNLDELDYWQPLTFEQWILIKPRPEIDEIIHTSRLEIRCPHVIVTNYSKMPMRRMRPVKSVLYNMQGGVCGYTGEKISMKSGTIEHRTPKSFGGRETFENLLVVKAEINHKRGNRPLEELGLKPLFHHKEPRPIPVSHTIKGCVHSDWRWFINT